VLSKLANVSVPLVLKEIIDALDKPQAALVVPVFLVVGYGVLRLLSTLFRRIARMRCSPGDAARDPARGVCRCSSICTA